MALERRLLPVTGSGRRALTAAVLLGIASGALVIAQAFLLARLVTWAARSNLTARALLPSLSALTLLAVLRALGAWASEAAAARAAADVRVWLRTALASKLLSLGPRFAWGERAGELAHTLGGGVESTDAYVAQYLPQLAQSVAVPILVGVAVLRADSLSALVLAATWPLIPLFMYLIGGVARERTRAQWVTLSRMSARVLDAVQGVATLATLGGAEDEALVVQAASERFRSVTMGVLKIAFLSALTLEWLASLGTAVVAVELGLRLLYGRIAFESALFVLVVTPEFYRPLRALGAAFHAAMAGREAAGRMSQLLEARTPGTPPGGRRPERRSERRSPHAPVVATDLAFESVSFRYSADRPAAVEGVSFRVAAGSVVALLGPSGSGKSTLGHLVMRFVHPDSGRLLAGDDPIEGFDPDEWRRQVAWLPQRPHLFHGSVLDNLRLARPDASQSDIERAMALAHADRFVRGLPLGLRTPIGERGTKLSGGEAQRLALARAFLKDAPFLVLDEPTSHLDPENDALVSDAVRTLSRGRTVLLIAHRMTTVAGADLLVVLKGGRVVEQGTRAALVARAGVYARMVAASRGVQ